MMGYRVRSFKRRFLGICTLLWSTLYAMDLTQKACSLRVIDATADARAYYLMALEAARAAQSVHQIAAPAFSFMQPSAAAAMVDQSAQGFDAMPLQRVEQRASEVTTAEVKEVDKPTDPAIDLASGQSPKGPSRKRKNSSQGNNLEVCPYTGCPVRCSKPSALIRHIRTHTGEQPYACPECGMRFAEAGNCSRHLRQSHNGARPFACLSCEKAYKRKEHLMEHLKIPTREHSKQLKKSTGLLPRTEQKLQ